MSHGTVPALSNVIGTVVDIHSMIKHCLSVVVLLTTGPVMYVGVLLHAVLFPAWLTTLGVGIHKAAQEATADAARLSDSRSELSDQTPAAGVPQHNRANAP